MAAGCGASPTTVTPGSAVPPPYWTSSSTTRSAAAGVITGSTPRSLRLPASEVSLCRLPVRNIDTASQCAASTSTRVVVGDISVVSPPMTPPRPMIPESSVTTRSSVDSARSTPSSVVSRSPSVARRTRIGPLELVGVVAVDRPAELEHHVVGDVDRQRDRAHAREREPLRHPVRGRRRRGRCRSPRGPRRPGSRRGRRSRPGSRRRWARGPRAAPDRCTARRTPSAASRATPRSDRAYARSGLISNSMTSWSRPSTGRASCRARRRPRAAR